MDVVALYPVAAAAVVLMPHAGRPVEAGQPEPAAT
jgi:hypothetical protein